MKITPLTGSLGTPAGAAIGATGRSSDETKQLRQNRNKEQVLNHGDRSESDLKVDPSIAANEKAKCS